uniref:Uncharacterized protein n=1 Tax=Oryza sativa subsp. japonica TaxID=39947 RepID=Q6K9E1_ORYSJ|nr:hypothetical protein [Oryza sativa Japonica Group]
MRRQEATDTSAHRPGTGTPQDRSPGSYLYLASLASWRNTPLLDQSAVLVVSQS